MRMKIYAGIGLVVLALCAAGCDLNLVVGGAKKAETAVPIIADAADKGIDAVETATGKTVVTPEFAEKAASVSEKIETGAGIAKTGAETLTGFLPDDKKIYGEVLAALFGLTTIGASAAASLFNKRKNAALKTAVMAADGTSGGGKALVAAAAKTGMSVEIAETHESLKSNSAVSTGS